MKEEEGTEMPQSDIADATGVHSDLESLRVRLFAEDGAMAKITRF